MTEWGVHPEYAGRKEVIHRIGEERRWRFFHQLVFVPNSDRLRLRPVTSNSCLI